MLQHVAPYKFFVKIGGLTHRTSIVHILHLLDRKPSVIRPKPSSNQQFQLFQGYCISLHDIFSKNRWR
ncbi:hypothetical protein EUGRSUZ_C00852 [Eucalyptus grandis]|uniref:Uncharacterized protein n=2 Tax=Eucalyptus grandis TaxID=71139 RepID=A0ACC3LBD7_EUCGR|nr:hypothetical protein EUGRSUZ_C00852 [Eucalyptus grandis]